MEVETLWREEIPREVVEQHDLNGPSGRVDRGAVYHERLVESSSGSSLGRCDQRRQGAPPPSFSSPLLLIQHWIDKPDHIPGDRYHRGQAGCRKLVAQALLRSSHYSGQVDPANCASAMVASKRANCVMLGGELTMVTKRRKKISKIADDIGGEIKPHVQQQAALNKNRPATRLMCECIKACSTRL